MTVGTTALIAAPSDYVTNDVTNTNDDVPLLQAQQSLEPPPGYDEALCALSEYFPPPLTEGDTADEPLSLSTLGILVLDGAQTADNESPTRFRPRLPSIEAFPSQQPPPFTPRPMRHIMLVNCKVCQAKIDVTGKMDQLVVRCEECREATPLRRAPPGKKFVRCPCNCLLVSRSNAMRIACPRPECRQIFSERGSRRHPGALQESSRGHRVLCGHCHDTFVVDAQRARGHTRCPQCHTPTSVGPDYRKKRCVTYGIISITLLTLTAALLGLTFGVATRIQGLFVLYGFVGVLGLASGLMAVRFFRYKISTVIEPNLPPGEVSEHHPAATPAEHSPARRLSRSLPNDSTA